MSSPRTRSYRQHVQSRQRRLRDLPGARPLPLSAELSAAFVALTIEADNAAEQRLSHTTTAFGPAGEGGAVWLASLAMWFNCVGPLADAGGELTAAALQARARMTTNLDGMRRWGYITIDGTGRLPRRRRSRQSSATAREADRRCSQGWSRRPTAGVRGSRRRGCCRGIRSCCTAAATPTAADSF